MPHVAREEGATVQPLAPASPDRRRFGSLVTLKNMRATLPLCFIFLGHHYPEGPCLTLWQRQRSFPPFSSFICTPSADGKHTDCTQGFHVCIIPLSVSSSLFFPHPSPLKSLELHNRHLQPLAKLSNGLSLIVAAIFRKDFSPPGGTDDE